MRRHERFLFASVLSAVAALTALALARPAFAQAAPPKPADPVPTGDPPPVLVPLQYALMAPDYVPGERYAPGCEENATTTGNSADPWQNGLPWVRSVGYQLSPRLSVLAFSRAGCPITAGVGGAAAYTIPLSKHVELAYSGGVFAMPQLVDGQLAYKGVLRADVLWHQADGTVTHTGIEALSLHGRGSRSRVGVTYGFSF